MLGSEPWISLGVTRRAATVAIRSGFTSGRVLVARSGTEVDGFIVFFVSGAFPLGGYVKLVAVREGLWGRGVGRALLRRAEREIFKTSPNVFLLVSGFNRRAQGFYRHLGYRRVGEIPDAILPGVGELILRKTQGPLRRRYPSGR